MEEVKKIIEFPLLTKNDIDLRVGSTNKEKTKCTLLLYQDARVGMRYLDKYIGVENWQVKYYEVAGNTYASLGIKINNEWIWKDDAGSESNVEKEKGLASDCFKRVCVRFGIARELYTAPKDIWVPYNNVGFNDWSVKEIAYNNDREIITLVIVDKNNKVVYSLVNGRKEYIKQDTPTPTYTSTTTTNTVTDYDGKILDATKMQLYRIYGAKTKQAQEIFITRLENKYGVKRIDDLDERQAQEILNAYNK